MAFDGESVLAAKWNPSDGWVSDGGRVVEEMGRWVRGYGEVAVLDQSGPQGGWQA